MLKKSVSLYSRDDKEKLIAQEVELEIDESDDAQLEFKGEKVLVIPMTRGELRKLPDTIKKLDVEKDGDGEVIKTHCIEPSYSDEDIKFLKPVLANILLATILRESGILVKKSKKKAVEEAETILSKN